MHEFSRCKGYPVCRELFMEVRSIEKGTSSTIVFCLFKIQFHHIYVEYATNVLKRHFWDTISQRKKGCQPLAQPCGDGVIDHFIKWSPKMYKTTDGQKECSVSYMFHMFSYRCLDVLIYKTVFNVQGLIGV